MHDIAYSGQSEMVTTSVQAGVVPVPALIRHRILSCHLIRFHPSSGLSRKATLRRDVSPHLGDSDGKARRSIWVRVMCGVWGGAE